MRLWAFLSKEDNRQALTLIGGGLAALVIGCWSLFTYFSPSPDPSAKPGASNPIYVAKTTSIPTEEYARLAGELGVTKSALKSLFKTLEIKQVPTEDLDATLRAMAQKFKDLDKRLAAFHSDDPKVGLLKEQARTALITEGDFAKAEALLTQAYRIDMAAARAIQASADKRLLCAAETAAEQGEMKETQLAYTEAAGYYRQAAETTPASAKTIRARYLNRWGEMAFYAGRYADALAPFNEALTIRIAKLGPEHPDTAASLNNLALLHKTQGNYTQAEPLYRRALDIREQALGPEHPDTATSLNNLAELYRIQGDYTRAERLHQRALAIRERVLDPEHPDTAQSLNNLAGLHQLQGDYTESESLYRRALGIWEKASGPEHTHTAASLNNLAELLYIQGDYSQAEALYQRALAITEKALGPEHPNSANGLNNLAELYHTQGDYMRAERLHQRALAIREKTLGPEHPDSAISLNNLALLYHTQGNYRRAKPLYRRALAIIEKNLGGTHPSTRTIRENYTYLLESMHREEGSGTALENVHQVSQKLE